MSFDECGYIRTNVTITYTHDCNVHFPLSL